MDECGIFIKYFVCDGQNVAFGSALFIFILGIVDKM